MISKNQFCYQSQLIRVIDGDTIDVKADLGFGIVFKIRLRLARIDAPEVRGKEKIAGKATKLALQNLLDDGHRLFIETEKKGKFGRYLAEIWIPLKLTNQPANDAYTETFNEEMWININNWLVFSKLAVPYH